MKDSFNLEAKLINYGKISTRKIKNFKGGFSSKLDSDRSKSVVDSDRSKSVHDSDWSKSVLDSKSSKL